MLLHIPVRGYFEVNAYVYADDVTRHGFIIDPGAEQSRILNAIRDKNVVIDHILLTHGHFDHLGAADALRHALGVPIRMATEGRAYAENPFLNLSASCGPSITLQKVEYFDAIQRPTLTAGGCRLVAIPVPGHTPDSVLYYAPEHGLAFVGDTIFKGAMGTAQFPGGDIRQLVASIRDEILSLPNETALLSGHSNPTTVGKEKTEPHIRALLNGG